MHIDTVHNVNKDALTINNSQGANIQWLLAKNEGVDHFYMRYISIEPGGIIPLHSHALIHEMFIVKGKGSALSEGKETVLESGSFVYVEPNELHGLKNIGEESFDLICCINKPEDEHY